MEDTANLVVYRNGEIIRNTHEGVRFVSQNSFSFVVPCTMTLMELQNGLCQSMENGTLMRVSRILYRNPVVVFGGLIQFDTIPITDEASMQNMFEIHRQTYMRHPQIELYVEFEAEEAVAVQNDIDVNDDIAAVYEGMNSDSEEDFEATYEAGDEDEDGDVGVEAAVENVVVRPSSSQPMGVPPFMCELDLDAMHAPEFPEYANRGIVDPEDGEFRIGMEYRSRKSVVAAIRSFTISRGVDYDVFESEPQTFYAKCKMYGRGCDWLIRASLIRRKGCWEIRRYNGRHTCTIGTISQDHSKLDSDTVAEAIRPLVESDPSIKVKSIIAEVQSRFNYTISYRKAWLAKQKSVALVFGDWEESYQALPWWLSVMVQKIPGSVVQIETRPLYNGNGEVKPICTRRNGKYGIIMMAGRTVVTVLRMVAALSVGGVLRVLRVVTGLRVSMTVGRWLWYIIRNRLKHCMLWGRWLWYIIRNRLKHCMLWGRWLWGRWLWMMRNVGRQSQQMSIGAYVPIPILYRREKIPGRRGVPIPQSTVSPVGPLLYPCPMQNCPVM
ncbi:hypothetical protein Ahy_Scaffold1g106732 isoform K [Arachis hypogaea]|uniref:Transposase MuDR plant domain-containing protein n=1 Tax=Arachis hypogaea TaxID=3818 RepID=A0A444WRN1_ARAHY|nr:hypothetical protein Ahy_Scaffold1g106732 isoform K [Arachis hypogaea]